MTSPHSRIRVTRRGVLFAITTPGACASCGYSKRGLAAGRACPECGSTAAPDSRLVSWWAVALPLLLWLSPSIAWAFAMLFFPLHEFGLPADPAAVVAIRYAIFGPLFVSPVATVGCLLLAIGRPTRRSLITALLVSVGLVPGNYVLMVGIFLLAHALV